jgi:acetyl esterase/lipase
MKWVLGTVLVLALAVGAFWMLVSPPGQLNVIDKLWPGDGATQTGADIAFGKHGQMLDVWNADAKDRGPDFPDGASKPVLIFWYGGGWVGGDRDSYGWVARAYAAQGFVVVVPDYRKVPQVVFPDFVTDAADAVAWVEANIQSYGGDPARIAIAGHSAGAHNVAMLALDPQYLAKAGAKPDAIKAAVGLSGPYDFYPFTGRAVAAMSTWPSPAQTQPLTYVRKDAAPMMLVTGTEDTIVRPKNARNLAKALQAAGAPVVLKEYAGLGHEDIAMALSLPFRSKAPVLADSVEFINAALKKPN